MAAAALGLALLAGCAVEPPAGAFVRPTLSEAATPSPTTSTPGLFPPLTSTSATPTSSATATPRPTPKPTAAAAGCRLTTKGFVRHAPGSGKTVALTFDDGPAASDLKLLAVLARYKVKATFFFTGAFAQERPGIVKQVANAGHQVAGHSWSHSYPRNTPWTVSYLTGQWSRTRKVLRRESGQPVCFVRPPGGFMTNVLASTRPLRLTPAMWTLDTLDWQQPAKTTAGATAAIVSRATKPQGDRHPIVLMHSGKASLGGTATGYRGNTVAALPKIIEWYAAHGYRFVTLEGRR